MSQLIPEWYAGQRIIRCRSSIRVTSTTTVGRFDQRSNACSELADSLTGQSSAPEAEVYSLRKDDCIRQAKV